MTNSLEGGIFMDSIWTKSVELPSFPQMQGDKKTEVLIVGGGMAGILCAYFFQEQGIDYILAEGRTICSGITKNTTAKITSQHGLIYHKLIKDIGIEKTAMYLKANQEALQKYEELCQEIKCNFEIKPSYVYSLDDPWKIEQELSALLDVRFEAHFRRAEELPFKVAGAVCFENQAQFHPLRFVASIVKNLNIYEHTFVKELKGKVAVTNQGNITFQKIIFTTHFPIDNKHGMYFLKMYQHRSYVIALKEAVDVKGMYVDEKDTGLSFRNYGEYLLLGGGSHRTGKTGGNWSELRDFANSYYPKAKEVCFWATQDCMTLEGIPYIGQYSKFKKDYYVATGFNKWGMTSSMVAAKMLTDLVIGKENPYVEVFDPSRNIIKPQLFLNAGEATINLLTFSKKRCPHLGCSLKWNETEKSWDCPCHGSRFDKEGGVIDNPATGDLKSMR